MLGICSEIDGSCWRSLSSSTVPTFDSFHTVFQIFSLWQISNVFHDDQWGCNEWRKTEIGGADLDLE